jgi:hypothetical protein
VPFASDVIDVSRLGPPLLRGMWGEWSEQARALNPEAAYYAEKLAVPIDQLLAAGIDLRVVDLVRDPRDVPASIRAFTATGIDGFGRIAGQSEDEYLDGFVTRFADWLATFAGSPEDLDRLVLRYEDLATDLSGAADRLGTWLGLDLDADAVLAGVDAHRHHMTTESVEESIGRWRRDLSASDAGVVADRLGPLMEPYGYRM